MRSDQAWVIVPIADWKLRRGAPEMVLELMAELAGISKLEFARNFLNRQVTRPDRVRLKVSGRSEGFKRGRYQ